MSWELERLGKFTASQIGDLLKEGRAKDAYWGDAALTYIEGRAAEIFNQQPVSDLDGMKAIEWGNTYEPEAAGLLTALYPDFRYHGKSNPRFYPYEPVKQWAGGSPDGILLNSKTVVEIKCPQVSTHHIKYWRMKTPEDLKKKKPLYYAQIQFNMMCTGCRNGLFVSYDPRPLSPEVRLRLLEVPYDENYCGDLHVRLEAAVALLRTIIFNEVLGGNSVAIATHDTELGTTLIEPA